MKYASLWGGGLWILAPRLQEVPEIPGSEIIRLGEVVILATVLLVIVRSIAPLINALVSAFKAMNESNNALVKLVQENIDASKRSATANEAETAVIARHTQGIEELRAAMTMNILEIKTLASTSNASVARMVTQIADGLNGLEAIKRQAGEHAIRSANQQVEIVKSIETARDRVLEEVHLFLQELHAAKLEADSDERQEEGIVS